MDQRLIAQAVYLGTLDASVEVQQLRAALAEAQARVEKLEKAGEALKADLLMRSEKDSEGVRVVACGATVWRKFCAALDHTGESEK